jgi:hypothetical protein
MLVTIDAQDITALSQQLGTLVSELLGVVSVPAMPHPVDITPAGNFRGFDGSQFYVVRGGSITVRYRDKTIYTLEAGDILLSDITGGRDQTIAVMYGSDTGAQLSSYPALEFMQRVYEEPVAVKLWTRLLVTYAGLMLRIAAASAPEDSPAKPVFEEFEPGETIIRQGDEADYVYNMSSGVAEVLVDGVNVASVGEGEIFGAMAVLTRQQRSATVRARTRCSVVKVPREQFTELIKNNPATIHGLMIDMAHSIVNLNEQLVGSKGNPSDYRRES